MFDYNPMSLEAALKARDGVLDNGEYEAQIYACRADVSKNTGNNMFILDLDVYDKDGERYQIRDWWTFTPKMMWKVIHGCASAGVLKEFEDKVLKPELLVNKKVRVLLSTKPGLEIPMDKLNGKPFGSCYPSRNAIDDYLPRLSSSSSNDENIKVATQPKPDEHLFDDAIPF